MPTPAVTVAQLVQAVQHAVAHTFSSPHYRIRVKQVDLEVQLILAQGEDAKLSWQVLTVGGKYAGQQAQTLHLTWVQADQALKLVPEALEDTLISCLNAADIGVAAWDVSGLPLAFKSGELHFELAVSESGGLSVGVLKASAGQKETHSVVLKFG